MNTRKVLFFFSPDCIHCRSYEKEIIFPAQKKILHQDSLVYIDVKQNEAAAEYLHVDTIPEILLMDGQWIIHRFHYTAPDPEFLIQFLNDSGETTILGGIILIPPVDPSDHGNHVHGPLQLIWTSKYGKEIKNWSLRYARAKCELDYGKTHAFYQQIS